MLMQRRISALFTAVRSNQSTDESLSRDPNNNENDKSDNSSASESDQDETESVQATKKRKHAFQTKWAETSGTLDAVSVSSKKCLVIHSHIKHNFVSHVVEILMKCFLALVYCFFDWIYLFNLSSSMA